MRQLPPTALEVPAAPAHRHRRAGREERVERREVEEHRREDRNLEFTADFEPFTVHSCQPNDTPKKAMSEVSFDAAKALCPTWRLASSVRRAADL